VHAITEVARARGCAIDRYLENARGPTDSAGLAPDEKPHYLREKNRLLQGAARRREAITGARDVYLEAVRAAVRRELKQLDVAAPRRAPGPRRKPRVSTLGLAWLEKAVRAARTSGAEDAPAFRELARSEVHQLNLPDEQLDRLDDRTVALMILVKTRAVQAGENVRGKKALLRAARTLAQRLDS
jgi:hypothetical protein